MENPLSGISRNTFHESRKNRILNSITEIAKISDMMHNFFDVKFGYCIVLRYVFQPSKEKSISPAFVLIMRQRCNGSALL